MGVPLDDVTWSECSAADEPPGSADVNGADTLLCCGGCGKSGVAPKWPKLLPRSQLTRSSDSRFNREAAGLYFKKIISCCFSSRNIRRLSEARIFFFLGFFFESPEKSHDIVSHDPDAQNVIFVGNQSQSSGEWMKLTVDGSGRMDVAHHCRIVLRRDRILIIHGQGS